MTWLVMQEWADSDSLPIKFTVVMVMSIILLLSPYVIDSHTCLHERRLQTFTEFFFLTVTYLFYIFSILREEYNFDLGYITITVISAYFTLMLGLLVWEITKTTR